MNAPFATALAGWKASGKNRLGWTLVPNAADVDSAESMRIAAGVLDALGVSRDVTSAVPKDPGGPLEQAVCDHLREVLPGYRTGRDWLIGRSKLITGFDQYAHLKEVDALVRASPQLRISLGMDYLIKPDVTVGLAGVRTGSGLPPLHAASSMTQDSSAAAVRRSLNRMRPPGWLRGQEMSVLLRGCERSQFGPESGRCQDPVIFWNWSWTTGVLTRRILGALTT